MFADLLEDTMGKVIFGLIVVVLIACGIGIYYAAKDQARWEAWCHEQGGHVKDVTKTGTGTGIDSKGKPVVTTTTETTYYCLTEDGRILDIR